MDASSQGNSQLDPVLSNKLSKIGTKLGWFSETSSGMKTKKGNGKQKKKFHDVSDDKENDSSITSSHKSKASKKKGKKVLKENSQHKARKNLLSAVQFSSDSDDQSFTKQDKPKILAQDSSEDEFTAEPSNQVLESQCMVVPNTQCSQLTQPGIKKQDKLPEILVTETQDIVPKEQSYQTDVSIVPESCMSESLTDSRIRKHEISNTQEKVEESIVLNSAEKKSLLRPIVSSTKKKKKHKDKSCDSSLKSTSKKKFYNLVDFSSEDNSDTSKKSDLKNNTTENTDKPKGTKGKKLSKKGAKAKKHSKLHLHIKFSSDEESDNSVGKTKAETIPLATQEKPNTTNSKADVSVENLSQRLEKLLSATRSRKKKYEETLNSPKRSKRNLKFDSSKDKETVGSTDTIKKVVETPANVHAANGKEKTKKVVKPCSCNLEHSESHDHSMDGTPLNKGENYVNDTDKLSHISEEVSKTQTGVDVHHEKCESLKDKSDSTPDLIYMLTNTTKSSESTKEMYDTTGQESEESNLRHRYAKQFNHSDQSQSLFDSSKGSSTVSKTVSLFSSECCPDRNSDREGVSSLEVNDDRNCTASTTLEHYPFTSDPTVVEIRKDTQTAEDSSIEMRNISLQVSLENSDMSESSEISLDDNVEKSAAKVDVSLQCSMTSNEDNDVSHGIETENCEDYEEPDTQSSQVSQNDLIPSMKSLSLQVSMHDSYGENSVQSSVSLQENCVDTIQVVSKKTTTSPFCGRAETDNLDSSTQSNDADESEESNIELQKTGCNRSQDYSESQHNFSCAQSMVEMKTVSLQVSLDTTQDEASGMLNNSENNDDFSQDSQTSQASQTNDFFTNDEAEESTKSTQEIEEKVPSQSSILDIREGSMCDSQYFTSDASNVSSKHSVTVGNFSLQVSLASEPCTSQQSSLFTNDESQSIAESQTNILPTQSLESSGISEQTVETQESLFTSDTSKADQSITSEDQNETNINTPLDIVSADRDTSNCEILRASVPRRHPSEVSNTSTNISYTTACNDSNLLTKVNQDCSEVQQTLNDSTESVDLKSRSLKSAGNDSSIVTGFKNLSLQSSMVSSDGSFTRNESYNNLNVHHIESSRCDRKSVTEVKETDKEDTQDKLSDKSNGKKYEESSADQRQENKGTSEVEDDFYLPDIDEPPVSNKKQRRKSRSQRDKSLIRTPKAVVISDSSDDEDGLENFFQKMKTPAVTSQIISSDEEDNSMNDFIVSDGETSGLEDKSDSDSSDFYVKTNRIMDERETPKKPRYITLLSSSGDSDDDFQFKTPAVKTKRNIPEKLNKTVTQGRVNPINGSPTTEKTPKSIRTPIRPNTTGHTPQRFSFLKSLSSDVTSEKQNLEAKRYKKDFKKTKEELTSKLFQLYNSTIFGNELPQNLSVTWNSRLYKTAGFCAYKRNVLAENGRTARIELSVKVCDTAERVRDTLVHELCHAAVWLMYGKNDGHGPYWKQWARKANQVHPDLPPIKRCHTYEIDHKYIYKCTKCGYQIGRHSKSLDTARKVCGYCQSPFELLVKSKGSAGKKTPQTPRTPNSFALFVKANYGSVKKEQKGIKHQEVMKMLSAQFQAQKIST